MGKGDVLAEERKGQILLLGGLTVHGKVCDTVLVAVGAGGRCSTAEMCDLIDAFETLGTGGGS